MEVQFYKIIFVNSLCKPDISLPEVLHAPLET